MNTLEEPSRKIEDDDRQWVAVTETYGAQNTGLVIEYLRNNGVHALALENSSLALITGANSSARVMVPEEDVATAMDLLDPSAVFEDVEEFEGDDESESESSTAVSDISKAVLGVTAVALTPIGAGIAYAITRTALPKSQPLDNLVDCPNCGEPLELSDDEFLQGQFTCPVCHELTSFEPLVNNLVDCPECGVTLELSNEDLLKRQFTCPECEQEIQLDAYTFCPRCQSELELDEEERSRGWYICSECHWAIRLDAG